MAAQTEYLNRIQSYDNAVVGRVKTLRNEVQSAVGRLTATRREDRRRAGLDRHHRGRKSPPPRKPPRRASPNCRRRRRQRRETMDSLESKEEALSNNLSSISEQIATQRAEEAARGPKPPA